MLVRSPMNDAYALFNKFLTLIAMKRFEDVLYGETCIMKFLGGTMNLIYDIDWRTFTTNDTNTDIIDGPDNSQFIMKYELSVYFDCLPSIEIKLICSDKSNNSPWMFLSSSSSNIVLYISHNCHRFTSYSFKEGVMETLIDCTELPLIDTKLFDTLITEEKYFQNSLLYEQAMSYEEYTKLLDITALVPADRYITMCGVKQLENVSDEVFSSALRRLQGTIDTLFTIDAFDSL